MFPKYTTDIKNLNEDNSSKKYTNTGEVINSITKGNDTEIIYKQKEEAMDKK